MPDVVSPQHLQLLQQDLHTTKELVILEIVLVIISVISIIVLQCLGLRGSRASASAPPADHLDLERGLAGWLRARGERDAADSPRDAGSCKSASPSYDTVG